MVDHVDFVVPRGFPHPRRSVFEPPFIVEDDAFAEHTVEIHIYFLPELSIPPITVLHSCLLHAKHSFVPMLRGAVEHQDGSSGVDSNHGKTRTNSSPLVDSDFLDNAAGLNDQKTTAPETVVSERKDAVRIFHPSSAVVCLARRVSAFSQDPQVQQKEDGFRSRFTHRSGRHDEEGRPWRLGGDIDIERCIKGYCEHRLARSVTVLQSALRDLEDEGEELVELVSATMQKMVSECERTHSALCRLKEASLALC